MQFQELKVGDTFVVNDMDAPSHRFVKRTDAACTSTQGEVIPVDPFTFITRIPIRNRFDMALEAQAGACNLIALSRALVTMIDEVRSADNYQRIEEDPAVRLMIHQLAHLTSHYSIDNDAGVWTGLMDACRAACNLEHNRNS